VVGLGQRLTKRRARLGMVGLSVDAFVPIVVLFVVLSVDLSTAFWVYTDDTALRELGRPSSSRPAPSRSIRPLRGALGCVLLWIVVFPLYITTRYPLSYAVPGDVPR
jgi:hypothetical protein